MIRVHRRHLIGLGVAGLAGCANARATYDVSSYGAGADGAALATPGIQAAIDAASAAGGGTVVLKSGTYLSGSLFVKSGVTLRIERGATLKGAQNIAAYPLISTRVAGIEMEWPAALINIYRQSNASITGEGTVDGDGKVFWDSYRALRADYDPRGLRWAADYDCKRPRLIHVFDSDHAEVSGLNLTRSGFWTVHLCYSRDVHVSDLTIRNNVGGRGPSTDGIDVDSCDGVRVERCDISCNDDALCMKAGRDSDGLRVARPCRNVTIRDCVVRDAAAGVTFGSETSGTFDNIDVAGIRAEGPTPVGILFKSAHTRGGGGSNIRIRDVQLTNVPTLFRVNLNWNPTYSYAQIPAGITEYPAYWRALATPVPPEQGLPRFSGVHISDVTATGGRIGFEVAAFPERPLDNFSFERLRWQVADAGAIANARGWRFADCQITAADGRPVRVTASENVAGL